MTTINYWVVVASLSLIALALEKSLVGQEKNAGESRSRQTAMQVDVKFQNDEKGHLKYWLYLPDDYNETKPSAAKPLMLFLHGRGESGDDLDLVKKWGPPSFLDERGDFPFIVVSPQCPDPQKGWDVVALKGLLDRVVVNCNVDISRIYVTGLSMGGHGTWRFVAKHPDKIAAAIPVCGWGNSRLAEPLVNVPIWAFHGDADLVIPVKASKNLVAAIKELKGDKVKLTIYEGVDHNSWSQTYANKEIYEWLLKHKRDKE